MFLMFSWLVVCIPKIFTLAGSGESSRKKVKVDVLKKFLEPSFSMFENAEVLVTVDEYGASIDDLHFKDIQSIDTKWCVCQYIRSYSFL